MVRIFSARSLAIRGSARRPSRPDSMTSRTAGHVGDHDRQSDRHRFGDREAEPLEAVLGREDEDVAERQEAGELLVGDGRAEPDAVAHAEPPGKPDQARKARPGPDHDEHDVAGEQGKGLQDDVHPFVRDQPAREGDDPLPLEVKVGPEPARVDPRPEPLEVHCGRDYRELPPPKHRGGDAVALRVDDDPVRSDEGGGQEDGLVEAREQSSRGAGEVEVTVVGEADRDVSADELAGREVGGQRGRVVQMEHIRR